MTCPTYGDPNITYGDGVFNYDGSLSSCASVEMYYRITEVWRHLGLDPLVQPGTFTNETIWQTPVEGVYTAEQMLRLALAVLQGQISTSQDAVEEFYSMDGTVVRLAITVNAQGDRTVVVRNAV